LSETTHTADAVSYPDDYAAFEAQMQGGKTAEASPETPSEDSNESERDGESETPKDTEPPAKPQAKPEDEAEQPEAKAKPEDQDEDDDKPESKRGINKRFRDLTSKIRGLETELARTKTAPEAKPEIAKPESVSEGKPVLDTFDTYEAFIEALSDWKADQRDLKRAAEETARKADEESKVLAKAWTDRQAAAKATYADYDEALEDVDDIVFPSSVRHALSAHEAGPELAYQLAKNRPEAERISKLDPIAAVLALGVFAAKSIKSEAAPQPKLKVSSAPEPITPASKPSASRALRIDDPDIDFAQFEKTANARFNRG